MQFKPIHLAAAGALLVTAAATAQTGVTTPAASAPSVRGLRAWPVSPQQRASAEATAHQGIPASEVKADAPQRYTVKHGDTLWGISGMYLKQPWQWPELWGMNMGQIRNPHWIFPGQVLVLTIVDGRAHLAVDGGDGSDVPAYRLEPGVQAEALPPSSIPALDPSLVGPFLTRPLIVEPATLEQSPRIVELAKDRVMAGTGERAYVRGALGDATHFDIYRPQRPLVDPETHKVIAYEADYLGSAELTRPPQGKDAVATITVTSVAREIGIGDRLVATPPREYLDFTPKAPAGAVSGRIVSIYDERQMAGRDSVVAIDRGAADGLERGDVLAIQQDARPVVDRTLANHPTIELPPHRVGLLMVFRTFEHVAYGLVLQADEPLAVADRVAQP